MQNFEQFCRDPVWSNQNYENNPFRGNINPFFDNFDSILKEEELFPNHQNQDQPQIAQKNECHPSIDFNDLIWNQPHLENPHDDQSFSPSQIRIQDNINMEEEINEVSGNSFSDKKLLKNHGTERGRYNILSEELKRQIVEETKENTVVEIAKKYGVSVNNICRWRKRCDRRTGAGRKVTDIRMQKLLLKWIRENKGASRKLIQEKAKQLSSNHEFKASKGWFQRFFKRNKLGKQYGHLTIKKNEKKLKQGEQGQALDQ